MKIVKRVGVWSVARTLACIYAVIGLIIGAMFLLISGMGVGLAAALGGAQDGSGFAGLFLGAGAILFFPILYAIIGIIGGAIVASLYNFVAGRMGGVEVYLEDGVETGPLAY